MSDIVTIAVFCGVSWLFFKVLRFGRREDTLPPGPPTVPILGNAHLLPTKFPYIKLAEWGTHYDGIFSLKVLNGAIVVVSDMKTVKELLDDRSAEFASRPVFLGMDAVTGGRYIVASPAESHFWKITRKVIQPLVSPQAVQKYCPLADMETTQLLYDILHEPEALYNHITRSMLSFITTIVFGQRTSEHDSPIVIAFREYIEQIFRVFSPESVPVNFIPALMYVPERWAPWKKMWKKIQAMQCSLYFKLFREVERRKRAGMIDECFAAKMLEQQEDLALERDTIVYICGVLLDGGAETTASFLQNLILCLVKYPAVLKKAQAEVDNAVGDRLPDSNDIKSMPYVQAIIKETHRFLPTAPTSIPHASVDDSEYRGYIIPRKTPILINVFGICRDPKLYERPEAFWPERYLLSPDGTMSGLPDGTGYTRTTLPFGSGKRLCPGMHLANTNINLAVMRLLWAFDFASIDSTAPSTPKWDIENEFVDGITLSAKPFQCKITPRSTRKASIIEKSYKSLRDGFGGQLQ